MKKFILILLSLLILTNGYTQTTNFILNDKEKKLFKLRCKYLKRLLLPHRFQFFWSKEEIYQWEREAILNAQFNATTREEHHDMLVGRGVDSIGSYFITYCFDHNTGVLNMVTIEWHEVKHKSWLGYKKRFYRLFKKFKEKRKAFIKLYGRPLSDEYILKQVDLKIQSDRALYNEYLMGNNSSNKELNILWHYKYVIIQLQIKHQFPSQASRDQYKLFKLLNCIKEREYLIKENMAMTILISIPNNNIQDFRKAVISRFNLLVMSLKKLNIDE